MQQKTSEGDKFTLRSGVCQKYPKNVFDCGPIGPMPQYYVHCMLEYSLDPDRGNFENQRIEKLPIKAKLENGQELNGQIQFMIGYDYNNPDVDYDGGRISLPMTRINAFMHPCPNEVAFNIMKDSGKILFGVIVKGMMQMGLHLLEDVYIVRDGMLMLGICKNHFILVDGRIRKFGPIPGEFLHPATLFTFGTTTLKFKDFTNESVRYTGFGDILEGDKLQLWEHFTKEDIRGIAKKGPENYKNCEQANGAAVQMAMKSKMSSGALDTTICMQKVCMKCCKPIGI